MYKIEQIEKEIEDLPNTKKIDSEYIDTLLSGRVEIESPPSLRIRDEVHIYHQKKWEKDLTIIHNRIDSIIANVDGDIKKKQLDKDDADITILSIQKQIPDINAEKLLWDRESKWQAYIITAFLVLTFGINIYNLPKLLANNSPLVAENELLATLFCITLSLSAIGYKFAEHQFEVLRKHASKTTAAASIGVLLFSTTAIISFLMSSFFTTSITILVWDIPIKISGLLEIITSGSIFFSELCTSMLFSKCLFEITEAHSRKDKDNPDYIRLKDIIKEYEDLLTTHKTATILRDTITDLKSTGIKNYTQRSDAYLLKQSIPTITV